MNNWKMHKIAPRPSSRYQCGLVLLRLLLFVLPKLSATFSFGLACCCSISPPRPAYQRKLNLAFGFGKSVSLFLVLSRNVSVNRFLPKIFKGKLQKKYKRKDCQWKIIATESHISQIKWPINLIDVYWERGQMCKSNKEFNIFTFRWDDPWLLLFFHFILYWKGVHKILYNSFYISRHEYGPFSVLVSWK